MEEWKQDICPLLPDHLSRCLRNMSEKDAGQVREIRIRCAAAIAVDVGGKNLFVCSNGQLTASDLDCVRVTEQDCRRFFGAITQQSPYSKTDETSQGYLTLPKGYRIGVAGQVTYDDEQLLMKYPTCFNIRIVRQVIGCSDSVMELVGRGPSLNSILIISPPGMGKTTLIRDIARNLSGRREKVKVGIVDERNEITGSVQGIPQSDVGSMTDILCGCNKYDGIMLLLRSFSPQLILTDEIGRQEDALALEEARNSGVAIIATVHGTSVEDVGRRKVMADLINAGYFDWHVVLAHSPGHVLTIQRGRNQ